MAARLSRPHADVHGSLETTGVSVGLNRPAAENKKEAVNGTAITKFHRNTL